jgi:hypothetical protein
MADTASLDLYQELLTARLRYVAFHPLKLGTGLGYRHRNHLGHDFISLR